MKKLLLGAAMVLALGGLSVGLIGGKVHSQPGDGSPDEAGKATEGEIRKSPFGRMMGRWDIVCAMGEGEDAVEVEGKIVRELKGDNVLVEVMSHAGPDGKVMSMTSHYFYNRQTGGVSFTTTCSDCDMQMYAAPAAGGKGGPAEDGSEVLEFDLHGCPMAGRARIALGQTVETAEDGTETVVPFEQHTMFNLVAGSDGTVTEKVVATARLTPTVIPVVPDMTAMMAQGTPGDPHVKLAGYSGEWKVTATFTPKGMPAMSFPGTSKCELVMNNLFLRETMVMDMGEWGSQSMELTHGFDNASGKYQLSMISADSTGMMTMTGTEDAKTGEITFEGPYYDTTIKDYIGWRAVMTPIKNGKSETRLYGNYGKGWEQMGTISYVKADAKAADAPAGK